MEGTAKQAEDALQAAQMYYYQNLPMKKIAAELGVSPSTISRLLSWARERGIVEIRINDLHGRANSLEELIKLRYQIRSVVVVPVPEVVGQDAWQDRVARVAASYLNQVMKSNMVLGIAWGRVIHQVAAHLTPKLLVNAQIVQLNGGDALPNFGVSSAVELITRFANNYDGTPHLFHVPPYFDSAATKAAVWQERSVQRILNWHERVDIALYSIGSHEGEAKSDLYLGDYLLPDDYISMRESGVVGDIANIMIRADGSFADVPLNQRACGFDLELLHKVDRAICVVSGQNKLAKLQAALTGRYVTDLIVDEPTARRLSEAFSSDSV